MAGVKFALGLLMIEEIKGTFKLDNEKYDLIRCPKCNQENYAMIVMSGICCWGGVNANKTFSLKIS